MLLLPLVGIQTARALLWGQEDSPEQGGWPLVAMGKDFQHAAWQ